MDKIRRQRRTCATCRTPIYVALGTPDEQRTSCRYCLHTGFQPITGYSDWEAQVAQTTEKEGHSDQD